MRYLYLLIPFFIFTSARATATIKIYIRADTAVDTHRESPYSLINSSDTSYIDFSHMEDMGMQYGHSYYVKSYAPNDIYEIYVNNRLVSRGRYSHGRRQGAWVIYRADGSYSRSSYDNGNPVGEQRSYDKNGRLKSFCWMEKDCNTTVATRYYKNGNVSSNTFHMHGTLLRQEEFEKDGCLKRILHHDMDNKLHHSDDSLLHGKFHGSMTRTYMKGRFELVYDSNHIVQWKFYDFDKNRYTAQYPPGK
jgi:hypothetical protein